MQEIYVTKNNVSNIIPTYINTLQIPITENYQMHIAKFQFQLMIECF